MVEEKELNHIKEKMETIRRREFIGIVLVICGLISFSLGYYFNFHVFFKGMFAALMVIGTPISIYYELRYYSLKLELERKTKVEIFY